MKTGEAASARLPSLAAATLRASSAPYAVVALLGVLAYQLPQLSPTGQLLSLATSAMVVAVAAAGLGFLWGQSGQLTLAHAALFGIGAYSAAIVSKHLGLGFMASLPISVGMGLLAGALVALPSLRTSGHYFVILTFAIGEVVGVVETRLDWLTGGVNGMTATPGTQTALGHNIANRAEYYGLVIVFATLVFLFLCWVVRSRWGTVLRGMRENSDLARSLGVNVPVHRVLAFALSGAIAGLGGHLYLYQVKFIAPVLFTSQISIVFLLAVLIGGKNYLLGPAVGALIYIVLPEFIHLSPILSQIAFGALLILMILAAPGGLLSIGARFGARKPMEKA
jgi:branched-chain amino acid transport system permease protein